MKKVYKILLLFSVIGFSAAGYGFYLYHKKPADVRKITAQYVIDANSLVRDFNKDEVTANRQYLDKVIAVKGIIDDVKIEKAGQLTIFLNSGDPLSAVTCSFYNEEALNVVQLRKGDTITVKGICTGKLSDVVLNKCSINMKN